jgi:hypothetical protein
MKQKFILLLSVVTSFTCLPQSTLIPCRVGNKWGYSDTLGKIVIEAKYDRADLFYYGEGFVKPSNVVGTVVINNKILAIDQKGNVLVPGVYGSIETSYIKEGVIFIVENAKKKKGLFAKGKEIAPCIYDEITPYPNDSYLIQKGEKAGIINSIGKLLIPAEYDEINVDENNSRETYNWQAVKKKSTTNFPDKKISNPKEPAPPQFMPETKLYEGDIYDHAAQLQLKNGLDSAIVKYNMVFLYKKGTVGIKIFDPTHAEPFYFTDKFWVQDAEYIANNSFDKVKYNARALVIARNSTGKAGIVTGTGKIILPFEYDEIIPNGSYLILKKASKTGFLLLSTPYPFIKAVYHKFYDYHSIPVNPNWSFGIFNIEKNGKEGYVGENGIEFFRDK